MLLTNNNNVITTYILLVLFNSEISNIQIGFNSIDASISFVQYMGRSNYS